MVRLHCCVRSHIFPFPHSRLKRAPDLQRWSYIVETGGAPEVDCIICLDAIVVGEEVTRLPCGHTFHKVCIESWLQYSDKCPLRCRHTGQMQADAVLQPAENQAAPVTEASPGLE